jgi:hypothetical protein
LAPNSMDRLAAILKLAHRYDMNEALQYARSEVDKQSYNSENTLHLIDLSRRYGVDQWFELGFRRLIWKQMSSFTREEMDMLGFRTMMAIAKVRESIDEHRKLLARIPPTLHHAAGCQFRSICQEAYEGGWFKCIGLRLVDPAVPLRSSKIAEEMVKMDISGMGAGCLAETIVKVKASPVLDMENQICNDVIAMLKV